MKILNLYILLSCIHLSLLSVPIQVPIQVAAMKNFTRQIELATNERKPIIMLGDMNMCSTKWNDEDFTWKNIAENLQGTLVNCGHNMIKCLTTVKQVFFSYTKVLP